MSHDARACPVCGSNSSVPLYMNAMAPLDGLDMSYRIARCAGCGFVFADHLPVESDYAAYYRFLSKYDVAADHATLSAADHLRRNAAVAMLRPHAPIDARIADLGCGSGMLLGALRDAGWLRLSGIDPAPRAPEQALRQFGLDCIRCGTLDQAPALLDLQTMDVVCLTGVLEHLPRLREDLLTLAAAIGPETRILVEVPALERFAKEPCEPYGEFSLEHIQYFSTSSLTALFASLGFVAVSTALVDLPEGYCDSLFGLFARHPTAAEAPAFSAAGGSIGDYIARSEAGLQAALARIAGCPAHRLVIYGAGSHTARLLPRLAQAGESRVAGLVDSNPNLHGKRLGHLPIEAPDALDGYPDATILVSSFRAQNAIGTALRATRPNPLLTLY